MASSLSRYLFKHPQHVCFAVYKENDPRNTASLTVALVCVPYKASEQFNSKDAMKDLEEQGRFTRLAYSTSNKPLRPNDKAYIKVEGCYENSDEDILLKFIENEVCRKEILLRKSNSGGDLVISFLKRKDCDVKENLCEIRIDEMEICSVNTVKPAEQEAASPGPSAATCQELVVYSGDQSIQTIDVSEAATKVTDLLNLDMLSLEDPPKDIMDKCRRLCSYLKSNGRVDIVKKLRESLPSGMTGPLGDGTLLVRHMDSNTKERLSRALTTTDGWKAFAEKLGLTRDDIDFYDKRKENPVLDILNEHCWNMTVEDIYILIVESGANVIADYL